MLKNYIRIAFRNLKRYKTYSMINILGLALGILCSIVIYKIVSFHTSFDKNHTDSDRIYRMVTEQHRDEINYVPSVPNPLGKAFREDYSFAEEVARICTFYDPVIQLDRNGAVVKYKETEVAFVEPSFFSIFNYPMLHGGTVGQLLDGPNTVILTESLAGKYFGTEDPVNQVIRLENKIDLKVMGVLKDLPENTLRQSALYISFPTLQEYNEWFISDDSWGGISSSTQAFVKLKPEVSVEDVEDVLPTYVQKHRAGFTNIHHYKLQPLSDIHFNPLYGGVFQKRDLWILSAIGVLIVLTAGVNFVNMATGQAIYRSKEVGIRKVLGGNRTSLFWQFILETSMITVAAMAIAAAVAFVTFPAIRSYLNLGSGIDLSPEVGIFMFLIGLAMLITFLSGSYPGLILSRFQPAVSLKGKPAQSSSSGFGLRRLLIIGQFVVSQLMVFGLLVVLVQMNYVKTRDLGFDRDAVVMLPVGEGSHTLGSTRDELGRLAGVESVTVCNAGPASGSTWRNTVRFESRAEEELFPVSLKGGDENYLQTFGLELLQGRNLTPADSARGFLVNETFVGKLALAEGEEVLGAKIELGGSGLQGEIVGVVRDFHDQSLHQEITAVAIGANPMQYQSFGVKINMSTASRTLVEIEKVWSAASPGLVFDYQFLDEEIASFYTGEERMLRVIKLFSGIAIAIGCMGLYGLVSFMSAHRTKEIGIRKILGGSLGHLFWVFGREFSTVILVSFLVAAPVGYWIMSAWLQNFQFRINLSPWIYLSTIGVTAAIAVLTVGYQSLKVALINPVDSLKNE